MKISQENIKDLMTKHICWLSEEELKALALLIDIKITNFKKSNSKVKFQMTHMMKTIFVECEIDSSLLFKQTAREGGIRFGKLVSFANAVYIFTHFFIFKHEMVLDAPKKLKVYEKKELSDLTLHAINLVNNL